MSMQSAREVAGEVTEKFADKFGRDYGGLIDTYRMEDADVALMTIGTVTGTARDVVDQFRANGKKVGLVKLRFFRPFPAQEIRQIAERVKAFGVYDRAVSYGSGGPSWIETRHALYGHTDIPVLGFLAGLGGRDVTPEDVGTMFNSVLDASKGEHRHTVSWIGTRGVQP